MKTWCFQYGSGNKLQTLQWEHPTSPRLKRARMSKSQLKTVLITFFDIKGTVHFEFIPQGQQSTQLIIWKH